MAGNKTMISDKLLNAIKELRDCGFMDHGKVSSYGESACCPAENPWLIGECECGADEHNREVKNAYNSILDVIKEEVNIPTLPKNPLDCHGIYIPDSMVIIGKSDIQ